MYYIRIYINSIYIIIAKTWMYDYICIIIQRKEKL